MALSKIDALLKKLAEAHPGKTGWDRFLAYKGHTWDDVIETDLGDPTDEEKQAITDLGYYGAPISQKTVNGLATASHYKPESPFSMHIEFPGERGSGPKFFKSKAELIKAAHEMGGGEAHDKATSWINDSGARISIEGATYGEVFPKHTAVPSATDPDADYHNEPPERPSHQGPPHPHDRWSDREFESNTGLSQLDGLLKKLAETHAPAGAEKSEASVRGVDWAEFNNFITSAVDKLSDVRDEHSSADGVLRTFGAALVDIGAALDLLRDLEDTWFATTYAIGGVSDDVIRVGNALTSLGRSSRHPDAKTEDGTAGPHDALAADPDYKAVTPREQNFLQNFLGTVTGNNSDDRMNFHNDVKSYGYKNPAKLTKLFAKHYPAFSASAQKGEARAPAAPGSLSKIDALLKQLGGTFADHRDGHLSAQQAQFEATKHDPEMVNPDHHKALTGAGFRWKSTQLAHGNKEAHTDYKHADGRTARSVTMPPSLRVPPKTSISDKTGASLGTFDKHDTLRDYLSAGPK